MIAISERRRHVHGLVAGAAVGQRRPPGEGQASMREVGGSGVPTLLLVDGKSRRLLGGQLLYGPADALLALFETPQPSRERG